MKKSACGNCKLAGRDRVHRQVRPVRLLAGVAMAPAAVATAAGGGGHASHRLWSRLGFGLGMSLASEQNKPRSSGLGTVGEPSGRRHHMCGAEGPHRHGIEVE